MSPRLWRLEKEIDALQSQHRGHEGRKYQDGYPDLEAAKDQLARLKTERDEALRRPPPRLLRIPQTTRSSRVNAWTPNSR